MKDKNYYDPAEHAPMYVAAEVCGPEIPAELLAKRNWVQSDLAIHSKHVWFSQWQDKVLSLGRPV